MIKKLSENFFNLNSNRDCGLILQQSNVHRIKQETKKWAKAIEFKY